MCFVYVLRSEINGDIYVGSTENVDKRLKRHNHRRVKSTKSGVPWILMETIGCKSRSEAVNLELFLKTGQQKEILRKKYHR
jgi:predicted GIY-YIG superfamily endonuclease